jgi:hypothetical protein
VEGSRDPGFPRSFRPPDAAERARRYNGGTCGRLGRGLPGFYQDFILRFLSGFHIKVFVRISY